MNGGQTLTSRPILTENEKMSLSIFGWHSCEPSAVRSGHCHSCGATWRVVRSEIDATICGLTGYEVRDENGEKLPLF